MVARSSLYIIASKQGWPSTSGPTLYFDMPVPRILPHILFTLYRDLGLIPGQQTCWGTFFDINYGPTWGTHAQFLNWYGLDRCRKGNEPCWPGLLYQNKPVTEILDDAWNGPGALWTTVRPNKFVSPLVEPYDSFSNRLHRRFPIEEAIQPLLTLPADESHRQSQGNRKVV